MIIREPMTMLTDYLAAAFCAYFAFRLFGQSSKVWRASVSLWAWGFLVAGIAAVVGGSFHGFAAYFSESVSTALWNLTVFLIGLAGGFMLSGFGAAIPPRSEPSVRWLIGGVAITLFGFALLLARFGFGENFNHNDVYHCIQIVAFYFLYRGACSLKDRREYPSFRG